MEDIDRVLGRLACLLKAIDEIDPLRETVRCEGGLEGLPVDQHKETRVALTPRRQLRVPHPITILSQAKIIP